MLLRRKAGMHAQRIDVTVGAAVAVVGRKRWRSMHALAAREDGRASMPLRKKHVPLCLSEEDALVPHVHFPLQLVMSCRKSSPDCIT